MSDEARTGLSRHMAEARRIVQIGGPVLVGSATDLASAALTVALIAHLGGANDLAAIGVAVALYQVVGQTAASISSGFLISGAMTIGRADGAGRAELFAKLRAALVLCLTVTVVGDLLLVGGAPLLVGAFHLPAPVASNAATAVQFYSLAFTFAMLSTALNYFLLAQGSAVPGMVSSVIGNILVLGIAVVLVPHLGAIGAVIATGAGEALSLLVLLRSVLLRGGADGIRGRAAWKDVSTQLRLSLPEMANNGLDYLGNLTWIALIAVMGAATVAVNHATFSLYSLLFSAFLALGVGTQVVVGQAFGTGSRSAMRGSFGVGLAIGALFGEVFGILAALFATQLASVFLPARGVSTDQALLIIKALVVIGPIMGASAIALSTLKGAGRTTKAAVINVGCLWGLQVAGTWAAVMFWGADLFVCYIMFGAYMLARCVWAAAHVFAKVLRAPSGNGVKSDLIEAV